MAKPNILLITTDQQRFDTIHALGNDYIYTPHMNWLADEGISFRRAYADCPVCMPSRASIMTGRHGYALGYTNNTNNDPVTDITDTGSGTDTTDNRSGITTDAYDNRSGR